MTRPHEDDVPERMLAARLHALGEPLRLDEVPAPTPGPADVLVRVEAVFVPPLLKGRLEPGGPFVAPPRPATMGYNAAGTVVRVGSEAAGVAPGARVVVNPLLAPPAAPPAQAGHPQRAEGAAYQGNFAFAEAGRPLLEAYPGALASYVKAPAANVARLPQGVSFTQGARFGYHGIAYRGLRRAGMRPGDAVAVAGATGTVGLGAVLVALALGARRVVALARDEEKLRRAARLDGRVRTLSTAGGDGTAVAQEIAEGGPVDVLFDALPGAAPAALTGHLVRALRPGGAAVLAGGAEGALGLSYSDLAQHEWRLLGTQWCRTADLAALGRLADAGLLPLDALRIEPFALEKANEAVERAVTHGNGFVSVVVQPSGA